MAFLIPENLRSRRDVPAAISMMARVLADALDFSATVWYEPLFDVSGERPDLVVLIPDAGVLVLQVLQDKRSSVAVRDGKLEVTAEGQATVIENPLHRAERFAEAIAGRVGEAGIEPNERLPVAAAAVFAYVDRSSAEAKGLGAVVPLERCLLREDLDAMASDPSTAPPRIARLMAAPLRDAPISPETERVYRAVIHPDTVLTPVQELPIVPVITRDVKVLDRAQESLAKTLGSGHRVIRGVAGSGKTVVLVHRARLLATTDTRSRILVTCYNRSLAGYLERQLGSHSQVRVRTLGAQLAQVLQMASEDAPNWQKESLASVAGRATNALDGLLERGADVSPHLFDHVLVDEAQDFPPEALRFATRMLRGGSDSLLVVTDAAQSLYNKGFTWKEAGIDAAGRTRVLRTNYRNTRQILEWAWSFLSGSSPEPGDAEGGADPTGPDSDVMVPPEAGLRDGPLPLFLYCGSPDEEVLRITELVREWLEEGVAAGDMAVLYGSRNAGAYPWVDKLQWSLGAAAVPHYWPTDPDNPAGKSLVGADREKVLISTIHSAKGLEFPNVIVCGYLDDKRPEELAANRRLVYVAMTRATNRLVLTASGRHEYIADLERGPAG